MRDKYWKMYHDIKHKEFYFYHYSLYNARIHFYIRAFLVLFSASNIGLWLVNDNEALVFLWAFLTLIAQALQLIVPYMQFSKREIALKYMLPQLSKLALDIDYEFINVDLDKYNEEEIANLFHKSRSKYIELEITYTKPLHFPRKKACVQKADEDCGVYFKHYYDAKEAS